MFAHGALLAGEKNDQRIDLRAPKSWKGRVDEAAAKKGLKASAYIRMVVTERMDADGIPRQEKPPPRR